jgi:hypothetical protein
MDKICKAWRHLLATRLPVAHPGYSRTRTPISMTSKLESVDIVLDRYHLADSIVCGVFWGKYFVAHRDED